MWILLYQYSDQTGLFDWDKLIYSILPLIGFIVAGGFAFFLAFRKERNEVKAKKREIHRNVAEICYLLEQYYLFIAESGSKLNFYRFLINATGIKWVDDDNLNEAMRNFEKYRIRKTEVEAEMNKYIAEYYSYFGEDKELKAILKSPVNIIDSDIYTTPQSITNIKTFNDVSIALMEITTDIREKNNEIVNKMNAIVLHIESKLPK